MTSRAAVVPLLAARFGRDRTLTTEERRLSALIGGLPLLTAEEEVHLAQQIEAGLYAEVKLRDLTAPSDESLAADYTELVRVGEAARERMIRSNVRLAAYWARRRTNAGRAGMLSFDDLLQEGVAGVAHAVRKWDFTRGLKFSTYASHWIRHYQGRAAWKSLLVHVPEYLQETLALVQQVRAQLSEAHGREPTKQEVAVAAGVDLRALNELLTATSGVQSLDAPVADGRDAALLGDMLADPDAVDPADVAAMRDDRVRFEDAWQTLTDRQQRVLRLRLGLDGGPPQPRQVVARRLGVAEFRVAQVERSAVAALTGLPSDRIPAA